MGSFAVYKGNFRFWLKSYLFFGVVVLTVVVYFYTSHVLNRMQEQSSATTRLFSRFIAEVVLQVGESGKREMLQDVLKEIRLPIILTDADGRPVAWRSVGISEPEDDYFEKLLAIDPSNPPSGRISRLIEIASGFDESNTPIPVKASGNGPVQGYVHYGSSKLQKELRLMPVIQLGIFLVFMAAGFQGFRYLKLSEQRSIWVGMAKETAHQLGTPMSALLGWVQIIKERCSDGDVRAVEETIEEMEDDLVRLRKVANRFSKIGSQPELHDINIVNSLEKTVAYFHKRLPTLKVNSTISLEMDDVLHVHGSTELLEWVFENLIKNSLDAVGDKGGAIIISAMQSKSDKFVDIIVRDTGKGIPAKHRNRIFAPGFTTKKRGWGLGLALTKRIVEEYHGGNIRLIESQAKKGSAFLIRLPAA